MGEVIEQTIAVTQPSKGAPPVAKHRAISLLVPFAKVKHLLAKYPPPKRPNRNRPVNLVDPELRRELEAWEAASDEAFEIFEDDLPE
jgi:hypothetical protein